MERKGEKEDEMKQEPKDKMALIIRLNNIFSNFGGFVSIAIYGIVRIGCFMLLAEGLIFYVLYLLRRLLLLLLLKKRYIPT